VLARSIGESAFLSFRAFRREGRENGVQADPFPAPDRRSTGAACRGGDDARPRQKLRRQSQYERQDMRFATTNELEDS
jgi:hypothetical protein